MIGNGPLPQRSNTSRSRLRFRSGGANLITVIVLVLIAVVGVLVVVNPSPKPTVDPATGRLVKADAPAQPTADPDAPADSDAAPPPRTEPAASPPAPKPASPPTALPEKLPIRAEPAQVDFGYVLVGQTVVEEVVLHNDSDVMLNVGQIHTACPCTEADVSPRAIAPRSSAILTLTYTAQTFPHVAPARSVRVQFREYPREMLPVIMQAAVGREIRINSDRSPVIKDAAGEILVESYDGEPFSVLLVDGRPPHFVDFDPASEEPRASYLVRYDFASSRLDGGVPRNLHIVTDRKGASLTEVPTRFPANFREALNADPASWTAENSLIQVGTLSAADATRRQTILLKRTRTEGHPQLEASLRPATGASAIGDQSGRDPAGPGAVQARVVEVEAGTKGWGDYYVTLEFTLEPTTSPGLHHDILTLLLPSGSYTELDVLTHVVPSP